MERFVEEYDSDTVQDFLFKLSPRGPIFKSQKYQDDWIYRGVGDDDQHKLIPSALRRNGFKDFGDSCDEPAPIEEFVDLRNRP